MLDLCVGGDGNKALARLVDDEIHIADRVALGELAAVGVAVGRKGVAALDRGVGGDGDDLRPLGLHAAVGVGLEALAGLEHQARTALVGELPAGEAVSLGVRGGTGHGVGAAGGNLGLGAGSILVKSFRDRGGLFRLYRGEHHHKGIDLGVHRGIGGESVLIKALAAGVGILDGQGTGLQGQGGGLLVGADGQLLGLVALQRVAPEVDLGDIEAIGRRDAQVALQKVVQRDAAGRAGEGNRGLVCVVADKLDGVGLSAQKLSLLLGADGERLVGVLRIGAVELKDQSLRPGDGDVCVIRKGHAGELEGKDHYQQQAEKGTNVVLHG